MNISKLVLGIFIALPFMKHAKDKLTGFLILLVQLILLYSAMRLLFLLFNKSYFPITGLNTSTFQLFLVGLRFDFAAICMINGLFALLYFIPFPFFHHQAYQFLLKWIFLATNTLGFLFSLADIGYFPFIQKRVQSDVFLFLTGKKGNDLYVMAGTFLYQNWFLIICLVAFVWLLNHWYQQMLKKTRAFVGSLNAYLLSSFVFLIAIGITIIGIRGGLQMKPLDIINASEMVEGNEMQLVLNAPFTVIKTLDKKTLSDTIWVPSAALNACDTLPYQPNQAKRFTAENVVVIIVESLSKEYLSFFGGKSSTPFLDSLFAKSLVFENGFANAKESIQGIPAILSSIPSWQDDPFIFSNYSTNRIHSLANLLKPNGYSSHFFHGGSRGTMGFNAFSTLAGFDQYYAREDYHNDQDYDGDWGIWDEPFLQYMANTLAKIKQPFVSTVFTLNTHHPFQVPAKYQQKFAQAGHPILPCVQYLDYSLRQYFTTIKQSDWFQNTLFVITADHVGPYLGNHFTNLVDHQIPIVFYRPDGSLAGKNTSIANQIDILPTLMGLLNYPKPFVSLGKNLLNASCTNASINYWGANYYYYDSAVCYQFNGSKGVGLYERIKDSVSTHNQLTQPEFRNKAAHYDSAIKKQLQRFNQSMIHNRLK